MRVLVLFSVLFSFPVLLCSQNKTYGIGDTLNESIAVSDSSGRTLNLKFPVRGNYVLVYRYRWKNTGLAADNADSVRLLENKISEVLLGGMVGNLKIYCIAYDRSQDFAEWQQHLKKEKPFRPSSKYKVEYYNLNGNAESEKKCRDIFTKLTMLGPDGRIIKHSSAIARFYYHIRDEKVNLKGKVVTVNNGVNEPLMDAMVHVQGGSKSDTLGKAYTDRYGDFEIKVPNSDTAYTLKAQPKDKNVKNVMLLTQEGKAISYLKKSFQDFEYKMMKADILELAEMVEKADLTLSFKEFHRSVSKEMMVVEDIVYEKDRFELNADAEEVLGKVLEILNEKKEVKLEVLSHTDAQGDDASNKTLSEKRAKAVKDYLVSHGLEEKRVKAVGMGEGQIRNRCLNGVACSDKEHKYNRRTEFKFSK